MSRELHLIAKISPPSAPSPTTSITKSHCMATAARERGNALYKQSKLPEAIKCYEEAASLAPDDPAPISNLSAAKFEMGQYSEAAELTRKALSLAGDESSSKDKLCLRLARCHLHCLQTQQARSALEKCGDLLGKGPIALSLEASDGVEHSDANTKRLRRHVLDRLPWYKPCLQDEPEYYPMGHDVAESLLDPKLAAKFLGSSTLSFLMCGIGDARHLWATLNTIVLRNEGLLKNPGAPKELNFTLVDLKAASLARILIVLRLMSQVPSNEQFGGQGSEDLTWVIAYLYVGHVVPPFVHTTLSRFISDLVGILERNSPRNPFLKWVVMSEETRVQVLHHLRLWSEPLDDLYRPANMRKIIGASAQDAEMRRMMNDLMDIVSTPATCEEDKATFDRFTITPPPEGFIRRHEPQIGPLLELTKSKKRAAREQARDALHDYINRNWKTNMTLIDLMWEAKKERHSRFWRPADAVWTQLTAMDEEPVSLVPHILGGMKPVPLPGRKGVIEILAPYFFVVSRSLHQALKLSTLRVEMIAGEMTDTMERLRYGLLDGRAGKGISLPLPQLFDRVHMSNIPDYVGGIFAPLEYAQPLLKEDHSSFQYNCLLNPPKFKSQEQFLSEHLLLSSKLEIRDHFQAELFDQYDGQFNMPGEEFYLGQQYWAWKLSGTPRKLSWGSLMPRARLERWLYAHFLKICLPAKRDPDDGAPVYAPLNLTALMRLLVRLADRGYPAHWLGAVIENLTSGVIKTTARAPSKEVMNVVDVSKMHPLRQISVAPWVAEFTTLVGIWRGLMPFGFVVANGAQVTLADVCEYSVTFPDFNFERAQLRIPHFILVFHNTDLGRMPQSLRTTLLDDELGDKSEQSKELRANGLHVVATFQYVTDTRTASFWMRQDVADSLRQGNWGVSIWRTDSWARQVDEVRASSHMVKGRAWE